VLLLQLFVGSAAFLAFVVGAPELLLLDHDQARGAFFTTMYVAVATEVLTQALIYRRLARLRYVLRALALGSRAFEPEEVADLARVPAFVTFVSSGIAMSFSLTTLLPFVRAPGIDTSTSVSLFLLSVLVIVAAGLPLFVLVRTAVSGALELVPHEAAREVLELLERQDVPRQRVLIHMVASVVTPLSFVAIGAALVAHAHVRAAADQARIDAAIALARAAVDPLPGVVPLAGRREAMRASADEGFSVRSSRAPALYAVEREDDGSVSVFVPLDEGHAVVGFQGTGRIRVGQNVLIASSAFLVMALWIGWRIGRTLADDLVAATRQVRLLGNEDVLRGGTRIARPARFQAVTTLGRAIEGLAERFRVFAAAQERAIEAREAALRLRGLLFASVSHDLKSPLNAVLGFCALAAAEPLEEAQHESVRIIERRGRELLALIETILDAARVEAQRLTLNVSQVAVEEVIERALERGDELGPMDASPVVLDLASDLPLVYWDDARMSQALAALIGHAKRLSPSGGVRLEAMRKAPSSILIRVIEPSGVFSAAEVTRLLDAQNAATAPRRLGGLALGLSLARALVQMHGGTLLVGPGHGKEVVFVLVVPGGTKAVSSRPPPMRR
jgi:signal transduction histidine kinase